MNEMNYSQISQIKLSQLRALVAVAEFGNFSEAGLQLNLSQSAVSHAIASLEAELGVVLLSRGRFGAYPTPIGEQVIDYARQVLSMLKKMVEVANLEKGLHGGNVRIACFRSVATHVLPAVIAQFRQRFPEINVTISEYNDCAVVEQALREGRADIGFTLLPTSDEFETWEFFRDDYIALLPPDAKLNDVQLTWQELASFPFILASGSACYLPISNYLKASKYPIKLAYQLNEDSTIISMVSQGLGASIMPRLAAEPIPPQVRVCSLPLPLERVIGVAVLASALHSPAIFAFLDTLKEMNQTVGKINLAVEKANELASPEGVI